MKVIGITGGVGCGKSTVLDLVEKNFNAYVIKADEVGRHVLDKETKGYAQFVTLFGEAFLNGQGEVDREKLAREVFRNAGKLAVLNSIVHPLVKKYIVEEMARVRCMGRYDYFFVEAALLFEDHYELFCDEVWYIYADESVRRDRLRRTRGYDEERISRIMAKQLTEKSFRENCDFVIDNSGSFEESRLQIDGRLEEIRRRLNQLKG